MERSEDAVYAAQIAAAGAVAQQRSDNTISLPRARPSKEQEHSSSTPAAKSRGQSLGRACMDIRWKGSAIYLLS
jgi:hypothetical protein